MNIPSRAALSFLFCLFALPANAADPDEDVNPFLISPEQLFSATVVSASKQEGKLMDAPVAISVLTNDDIRRSGANSIPEALRMVPGVQVARTTTNGWAISIRGFNSGLANKLLVLIDGREVYDHLFSGVYWDVQDTPLEDVERIEVIRGPGASLWGANAVNGVINILTKNAKDTIGGFVEATGGNKERGTVTARYGVGTENGAYRAYARSLSRGEEDLSLGGEGNDGWQAQRAGFRSDWHLNDADKLTVQGDVYHNRDSQFRASPTLVGPPFSITAQEEVLARGANLLARWNRPLDNGAQIQVQSYLDYTSRKQVVVGDERMSFDTELQYNLPVTGKHKAIVGTRYRFSRDELTSTPFATFRTARDSDQLFSAFFQDEVTLRPDELYLTFGSKLEHNDYTGVEIEPNVRLRWHPDSSQMFWTSASRAVRTPSRLERDLTIFSGVVLPFGPAVPVSVELQPSPDFESETVVAYEAGYRKQLSPKATLDAAVFFNDYSKLATLELQPAIFPAPTPPLHAILPILTTNATSAESYGLEISVDWQARDNLRLNMSHSLLKIDAHGPPPAVAIASEALENQSPVSQLNLKAQWDIRDDLAFDAMVYHVSPLSGFRVDDYWRADVRLGWDVTPSAQLNLIGHNILGNPHREFGQITDANATDIGPSVYGTAIWRF